MIPAPGAPTIPPDAPCPRFGRYAAFVLAFNLAVIVWGAYVRATGSGWAAATTGPSAVAAQVAPRPRDVAMFIEFTHRVTSGMSLVVVGLVVGAFRAFSPGHPARRGAVLSGVFIATEALLGAGLVLSCGWWGPTPPSRGRGPTRSTS